MKAENIFKKKPLSPRPTAYLGGATADLGGATAYLGGATADLVGATAYLGGANAYLWNKSSLN